jgi:alkanesulfonate monooxygenase SsuD/methylene tetrahydromethanopterin reductase-like flavin-dependent oxidoreductase (luciferase family)
MPGSGRLDPDLAQQAIEYCYQQDWSDGLPLVPVSQPLLDRFLAQTGRGPQEIVGSLVTEHGRDPAAIRLSTTPPVCCAATQAEAERRKEFLGAAGARMLSAGVVGVPGDVLGRLDQLAQAGIDTVYFHIYDVDYLDQVRLLGQEVVPHVR